MGKTGHLSKIIDNLNNNKNREYEYDALGRLLKAKGGTNSLWMQDYTYDRFGNRKTVTATGVAADSSAIAVDGIPVVSYDRNTNRITNSGFGYDYNGNQTRALAPDGVTWLNYEYDAANRVQLIKKDDGTYLQAFQYGSTNARLMDLDYAFGYLKLFASGGAVEYTEFAGATPSWTKSYTYLGDSILSTEAKNGTNQVVEYNHPDRLGTKTVTNQQAGTSYEQNSLPFGTTISGETTATSLNKKFTSYERSNSTGLDYAINRTYDSKQGRFTQVDPVGMGAASLFVPQTLNLYTYCGNDPVNHTDPSGLFWGSLFKWIGKKLWGFVKRVFYAAVKAAITAGITFITSGFNIYAAGAAFVGAFVANLAFPKLGNILTPGWNPNVRHPLDRSSTLSRYLIKNFAVDDDSEKNRKWGNAFLQALRILKKNEVCSSYIVDNSKTSDIISVNPAQELWYRSQNGKIRDADSYNVTDSSGNKGLAVTTQTVNRNTGRVTRAGDTKLGLIFYDDVALEKALGISAEAGRLEIMLHELKHALGGVHNGTKEEATWRENIRKKCIDPYYK